MEPIDGFNDRFRNRIPLLRETGARHIAAGFAMELIVSGLELVADGGKWRGDSCGCEKQGDEDGELHAVDGKRGW